MTIYAGGPNPLSHRHLPEAAPAINPTRLSNRDAASAISWKFQQAPKTRSGYFSLLRHSIRPLCSPDYFLDGPLTLAALFLFSAQLFPANRQYTANLNKEKSKIDVEKTVCNFLEDKLGLQRAKNQPLSSSGPTVE